MGSGFDGLLTDPSPGRSTLAKDRLAPALQLCISSLIWGFGFIATRWAMEGAGPLWVTTLRFGIAAAACAPFVATLSAVRAGITREQVRYAAFPGFFLAACLILQTIGLRYTTATNSSFLTAMYVVFVPPVAWLFGRHRVPRGHAFFIAIALLGTALMCKVVELKLNTGDLLTLACAAIGACHIVSLSVIGPRVRSAFAFNWLQVMWALAWTVPFGFIFEGPLTWHVSLHSSIGLFTLGILSSIVAFVLQVNAQRTLNPALASLLCLLESPFAAVLAFLLLGERLGWVQWAGAALIMVASLLAVRAEVQASAT